MSLLSPQMYEAVSSKKKRRESSSSDKKFDANDKNSMSIELDLDNSTGLVEPCLGVMEVYFELARLDACFRCGVGERSGDSA